MSDETRKYVEQAPEPVIGPNDHALTWPWPWPPKGWEPTKPVEPAAQPET